MEAKAYVESFSLKVLFSWKLLHRDHSESFVLLKSDKASPPLPIQSLVPLPPSNQCPPPINALLQSSHYAIDRVAESNLECD